MSMLVSEKNFLERIASYVPGVSGYREREQRRETDRRLREYLAGRVDEARGAIDALRRRITEAGDLKLLNDVAHLDKTLQKSASSLRYADYGYSGLFDQVKIREAELDRIYAYDLALLAEVQALAEDVGRLASEALGPAALAQAARGAEALDQKIVRRKEIFDTPAV
jgi:hypothetical protein